MYLTELTDLPLQGEDQEIRGVTQDSRAAKSGYLFAAIIGTRMDGRKFIGDAITHGATAILVPEGTELPDDIDTSNITLIKAEQPRLEFSKIVAKFYDKQPDRIAAVTGTSGKTSTVHFTQQLWEALGLASVSFGTLGVRGTGHVRSGSLTTPDPVSLHAEIADLAAAGITHLSLEASSHGLDQRRLDGLHVKAAAFTNLSHEHLDYHSSMEEYFFAKHRLFSEILQDDGVAVLNADIEEFEPLRDICKSRGLRVISYGHKAGDLKLVSATPRPKGQTIELEVFGQTRSLTLPLVGEFQAMNSLCALGLVMAEDPDNAERTDRLLTALETLKGAPGRLQLVSGHPQGAVYVDYAHKPEALRSILKTLRPYAKNRLICLVGCGGDRDTSKRSIMGQIADELSDLVVITDDNPRSEDPAMIREAMMEGAPGAQNIGGRREAISWAINEMKDGDVLVIAGKGHEQGQIIAGKVEPFDDTEEAEKSIQKLLEETQGQTV